MLWFYQTFSFKGGYYLTSVYASLSLIQSQPEAVPPSGLTNQARESLKEWSRRRSKESTSPRDNKLHQVGYFLHGGLINDKDKEVHQIY